jgi:glycosyltransferase involved in cell wall biosynthesis
MRVLSVTTVFPSRVQPTHGLFVYERLRHLAARAQVRVVAPIAWRARRKGAVPAGERRGELDVLHPTFFYVPRVLKILDGLCLFLSVLGTVRRLRRTFDFDVIDAHFAYPEGVAAALLSIWFRRPFTITMRGTEILIARSRLRRLAIRWALRRAHRVIAVADPLARFARSLGVPAERISVIENGVDTDLFRPTPRAVARQTLGLQPDSPVIVSVGHLSPRKGFQRVIRVLPSLLELHPDATFVIVGGPGGEPNNRPELDALVMTLGVAHRVIFAGPQPPSRVAEWLSAADVFVLASDYEGCPNVVLEALACGRPVVATRVGNVDGLVPGYAGVLVDSVEDERAMLRALDTALRATWHSPSIRACAERRSWSDVASRVFDQWQLACAVQGAPGTCTVRSEQTMEVRTP